jgi:E3 ubiquitin-protein ligase listerin
MKVRSDYINHLRRLDIVATHFVPNILNLLDLYDGVKKAFKLDFWAVDEYYIDCERSFT